MDDLIQQTLVEVARFLDRAHAPFALIGGLAVAVRGEPRATADVDIVVGIDLDRALALVEEFEGTVFRPLFPDVRELVRAAMLLPMRHDRTKIRIDLAIGLSGFERQVIDRATPVQVADRAVPVATAEDLILMKLLAARPRDATDVEGIVARQRKRLDWAYLSQTGSDLQDALGIDMTRQIAKLDDS